MVQNPITKTYEPFNFKEIKAKVPELRRFDCKISTIQFSPPLDSTNINHTDWIKMATIIGDNYVKYNGFVILHGTDTMSFSASALSFMLENLQKPVIFTGAQLPIGIARTDGRENLLTAIEIATSEHNSKPSVPEVCIYFENKLYRGNRTVKNSAEYFKAFQSFNYPALAQIGVHLNFNFDAINYIPDHYPFTVHTALDSRIAILKFFPGISKETISLVINMPDLKGLVIETFGAGNIPYNEWFAEVIAQLIERGLVVLNVTQCITGSVEMGKYKTSETLAAAGVINGYDITTEAAIAKLMFLLGKNISRKEIVDAFRKAICGEITIVNT